MEGSIQAGAGSVITPPSPQDQDHLVESFRGVTSAAPSEARFFLESHNWQLDAAVHSFFDVADDPGPLPAAAAASGRRRRRHRLQEEEEAEEEEEEDDEHFIVHADKPPQTRPATRLTAAAMESESSSKASDSRPAGGIRTLADLNRRAASGSDTEDSDVPQEYYTGGEKSGMLVQDPTNPSKGNAFVDSLFEQAKQMGATEEESLDNLRPLPSSRSFTGTGRLLSGETVQAAPQPPESIIHDVVFWADGFTVNGGPLRRFDDPENGSFLESIKRSECPKELEPTDRRAMVHVGLRRRDEKYPVPVKRFNPFGGVGRTLGTESSSSVSPVAAAPTAATASSPPSAGLSVDESLPSTSVQLRLADGTRMIARFNYHHTVGDIRAFIDASRPGAGRSYQLQTVGFPPKQLTDVAQTIEQAGLANSVVIQKL